MLPRSHLPLQNSSLLSSLLSQAGCCEGLAARMLGVARRWAPPLRMTPLFISRFVPVPGPGIGPGGP